jgi:hypothetical protein
MHRAFDAPGLVFPERTLVKTNQCIVPKLPTFEAKLTLALMVIVAVEADHGLNGSALPAHSGVVAGHGKHLLMVQSSSSSKVVIGLDFLAFHHKDTKAQRKAAWVEPLTKLCVFVSWW